MKKKKWLLSFLIISLFVAGCTDQGEPVKVTKSMNRVVSDYILTYNKDLSEQVDQQFEAHKIYGARKKDNGIIEVYLYYLYEEFKRDKETEVDGGSVLACVKLKKVDDNYKVVGFKEAEDGSKSTDSIKEMFPKEYAEQATDINNQQAITKVLQKRIDKQVAKWREQ
ncbi:hypothetical protein NIE88_13830 [Sporolactobacillus shoreicorticis]|uniref:Lipoprotein n=1 Tax=Sporolactobacillus shoreicorticis TaxID=1923877 RepID=A0ABW5S847_9BACL|nr:hypothetical protein [Sporolactobacillus shoreicorticis]MCO7126847.1 hypothetical protein [Sporolactobacillus shoreicorticis]